jgi:predicted transcriptional regulator
MTTTAESIQYLMEVSRVLGSGKRAVILFVLRIKPMNYTEIYNKFKSYDVKIGSSEIYKHLDILLKNKYIAKKDKVYLVTLKGKALIENLQEVSSVPPTVPKLQMVF